MPAAEKNKLYEDKDNKTRRAPAQREAKTEKEIDRESEDSFPASGPPSH